MVRIFAANRIIAALLCLIPASAPLGGCSRLQNTAIAMHPPASPFTALVLLDGVSVINTQKTLEDHVIGWVRGEDCSLVRASMGDHYCVDNTPPPTVKVTTYCYQSLAKVSCYQTRLAADEGRYYGARVDQVPVRVP